MRELREAVVFTVQDLLADPPFSRVDLISCRNVLIYLQPGAQEQILSLFHFALSPGGILFLGRSETAGKLLQHFEPINKKQRIYRHLSAGRAGGNAFGGNAEAKTPPFAAVGQRIERKFPQVSLTDLASKLLLQAFAPPSVLVDRKYDALFYSGAVDQFLQVAPGEANRNILSMAREGLRPRLREALEGARESGDTCWTTGARVQRDGKTSRVKIGVQKASAGDMFLVSFVEEPGQPVSAANAPPEDMSRVAQLEQELEATHKQLNAVIRDLELTNEDLRAVNEEALSVNEEFQSTNEELETSKEELQALNEELTALNSQLQETLEQQRATSADLQNILNSSGVATLFLDPAFNIRFFTPAAKTLFGVSIVDIGRPVADLAQRFHDELLLTDARAVLSTLTPVRREIESHDGNWYIRSIVPYRVAEGAVEGVVITFARISELKVAERKIEAAQAYAEKSSPPSSSRSPCSPGFDPRVGERVVLRSFLQKTGRQHWQAIHPWDPAGGLGEFLQAASAGIAVEDRGLAIYLPGEGPRIFMLSVRGIAAGLSGRPKILLAFDDVTDAKAKSEALAAAKEAAERANLGKSRFLAAASHDLRQPLQTLSLLQGMLADSVSDPAASQLIGRLDKTIAAMSGLLDTLLDINQLEAGVVQPKPVTFVINDVLEQLRTECEIHAATAGLGFRVVPCHLVVRTDLGLLEQILRNMLSNATKYTSQGKVLLRLPAGKRLSIEVVDTGTGIPQSELGAIFKEFHQLDNSARNRVKGLGLGLSIVQRIADLLELPITVRSHLGRGSVFAVELPLAEGPEPIEAADTAAAQEIHDFVAAPRQVILILDDDAEIRETLKLLLERRGYRTFAVSGGAEALAAAAQRGASLDLIIADYNLPGRNGFEIAGDVQKALGRKIPVIMLTGDISAATLLQIASKGYLHLYKPANAQTLMSNINKSLAANTRENDTPTVFIVDDHQELREAMRDMLELQGYRTEIFAGGASFLDAYSDKRRGCLLADAKMPGMGGLS